MHFAAVLPLLSAFTGLTLAQQNPLNISAVPAGTRAYWCTQQKESCPLLCLQYKGNDETTQSNSCDPDTLTFSCICEHGQQPNASEYSQTVPYFECTTANQQCVDACQIGDNACASNCRDNSPCGAQDPTRINATSTTSSGMSQTATGSASTGSDGSATSFAAFSTGVSSPTSGAGSGTNASGQSAATSLFNFGKCYGMFVVLGSVFAGFALVL